MISKYKLAQRVEPWWTLVWAPITQEIIFRYIPFQFFYFSSGNFWSIGLSSSTLFAAAHWYFGLKFSVYTFLLGLLCWWAMVNWGLVLAILIHAAANWIDLQIGWRKLLGVKSS